jgi:signal transduction histidine kinase
LSTKQDTVMSSGQAAQLLRQSKDKIIEDWVNRAREEVPTAKYENKLSLINSLPDFLEQMALTLSSPESVTQADTNAEVARKHGEARANTPDYNLDQVIYEYQVLREVIVKHLDRHATLSPEVREIVHGFVDRGIRKASVRFTDLHLKEVEQAIRARDEFLSIVSHELRTPLTGMKIQTELFTRALAKGDTSILNPTKITNLITQTDKGLSRLVRLIEDMLDISRIQSGILSFNPEITDLAGIARETLERIKPQLITAGIEPKIEISAGAIVEVDRVRIEQVLTNLFTNAIRYAPSAPLEIKLIKTEAQAVLSFKDHGLGIEKSDQEKIFMRFERLVPANHVSGLGLGLYISRKIIEGHGGSIHVESEKGNGACFIIKLPISKKGNDEKYKGDSANRR